MAKSPFKELKSENVLSAHLSGVQHAVNKIEEVLNMGTAIVTGHALRAVADQTDVTLHNIIYEGTIRNWLVSPTPVIKRDGVVVSTAEYEVQPGYGVVVFKTQQNPAAVITADFTHVTGTSAVITNLTDLLEQVESKANDNETNLSTLEGRVALVEGAGGGGGGTSNIALSQVSGGGTLNASGEFDVPVQDVYITNEKTTFLESAATYTNDIATASNLLEFFPIYISQRTIVDSMKIVITKQNGSNVKGLMGIFSIANGLPYKRLAATAQYNEVVSTISAPLVGGEVALEPGLYFLGRYSSGATQYQAINQSVAVEMNVPADITKNISGSGVTKPGAFRVTWTNNAALPATVTTTGIIALGRTVYTAPQLHVKKTY